jgi:hypothetical protein
VLRHGGHWKLADFGIARDQEVGTQSPTFLKWGSPPYMSPEIWQGKSPTVKTDLYALGCLSYELLTGAPPYAGDLEAIRAGHLAQPLPKVSYDNAILANLITRLIAKKPGDRPQDTRAVLDRLRRAHGASRPVFEAIVRGLAVHAEERSASAAADEVQRAAAEEAAETRDEQLGQALADLREIMDDAYTELRAVEPSAALRTAENGLITMSTPDAAVSISLWKDASPSVVRGDAIVLAGHVAITNRRCFRPPAKGSGKELVQFNVANLAYEAMGRVPAPSGHLFGMYQPDFCKWVNRNTMLHLKAGNGVRPPKYADNVIAPFSPRISLGLFREAVDLKPE